MRHIARGFPAKPIPLVSGESLDLWTLYDNPSDMPGLYVLRRFEMHGDGVYRGTSEGWASHDVEALRALMRKRGLYCIGRSENDEPHIVETWI